MVAKKTFRNPVSLVVMAAVIGAYAWICSATERRRSENDDRPAAYQVNPHRLRQERSSTANSASLHDRTNAGQSASPMSVDVHVGQASQAQQRLVHNLGDNGFSEYNDANAIATSAGEECSDEICPGVQMVNNEEGITLRDGGIGPDFANALEEHASAFARLSDRPADTSVITEWVESNDDVTQYAIDMAHAACFEDEPFPSARKCQQCHPGHYEEWSVGPHSYAQLSPVFNAMNNKLIELNNGTLGDFCIRCHTPVGMALDEPIAMSQMDRHPAAREGVTCVVCHRINQEWGKGSGRQALVGGGLTAPVYGPLGNSILHQVLADPDQYGVMTDDPHSTERARPVHGESVPFFYQSTSAFCGACHDVFAPNGFRLEDAFSEFKQSPAAREKGQSCQDCHMGVQPGVASGYRHEGVARVGNVWTAARKRTNHMMIGPDYSIVHPGIYPHNPEAVKEEHAHFSDPTDTGLATMREWLLFDYEQGWGTDAVERERGEELNETAPAPWNDQQMRFEAADILRDQFELLDKAYVARHQILATGYRLGDVELVSAGRDGIRFRLKVWNGTDGHGVPTGFDAERLVFLRVTVTDANGRVVFVSGDLDPNGDIRDSHSVYVHNGELPLDRQVFSLQSRFVTRNVRGGEREQVLNVPYSLTPLPFLRPETRPFTVLGRPLGARKHKQNIEVGGHRYADYHIQPSQLSCDGPYHVSVQLISGMVPVNLIHDIESVGFDYGLSAREVADRVVNGHQILHHRTAIFHINE